MPILKSAKKALRQSKKRRKHNEARKTILRAALKKAEKERTPASLASAYKAIDKSAKTGIIQKNRAARIKSRLARALK